MYLRRRNVSPESAHRFPTTGSVHDLMLMAQRHDLELQARAVTKRPRFPASFSVRLPDGLFHEGEGIDRSMKTRHFADGGLGIFPSRIAACHANVAKTMADCFRSSSFMRSG